MNMKYWNIKNAHSICAISNETNKFMIRISDCKDLDINNIVTLTCNERYYYLILLIV
jgi:hypothetical protein